MRIEEKDFRRKNKRNVIRLEHIPIQTEDGSVEFPMLKFPLLEECGMVEHCFTTRGGGVSEGIFESLNLSFTRGDEETFVQKNYDRLAAALHVEKEAFVCSDQTHTTNVLRVGRKDCGNGLTRPKAYRDVDGMITNEPKVVLSTFFADCVPLYFVDLVHRAIGLSHSGWRGTVGRMGEKTLCRMREEFGTNAGDVLAAIGPSICRECYEISGDVAREFVKEFKGHEKEILTPFSEGTPIEDSDKFHLDLWKCNEIVLTEAGILREHLAVTNICTCCKSRLLFSHRARKEKRGNLAAFLYIRA